MHFIISFYAIQIGFTVFLNPKTYLFAGFNWILDPIVSTLFLI